MGTVAYLRNMISTFEAVGDRKAADAARDAASLAGYGMAVGV